MNRNGIIVVVIVVVLALLVGIGAYVYYQTQLHDPAERTEASALKLLAFKWSELEQGPLKHSAESGHWFLDAIEFLQTDKILVHFEDGLNDEYALLKVNANDTIEVQQRFKERSEFQSLRTVSSYDQFRIYQYNRDRGSFTLNPEYKVFDPPIFAVQMKVKIAWLDPSGTLPNEVKPGDISGCDHVVLQERVVPQTSAPLTAALNELLKDKTNTIPPGDPLYNYIGNGNLALQSVTIQAGTAKIYLTGTPPTLGGVCDDPRLFIQVAQTARQFPTVQEVELYVNGVRNDGRSNLQG